MVLGENKGFLIQGELCIESKRKQRKFSPKRDCELGVDVNLTTIIVPTARLNKIHLLFPVEVDQFDRTT